MSTSRARRCGRGRRRRGARFARSSRAIAPPARSAGGATTPACPSRLQARQRHPRQGRTGRRADFGLAVAPGRRPHRSRRRRRERVVDTTPTAKYRPAGTAAPPRMCRGVGRPTIEPGAPVDQSPRSLARIAVDRSSAAARRRRRSLIDRRLSDRPARSIEPRGVAGLAAADRYNWTSSARDRTWRRSNTSVARSTHHQRFCLALYEASTASVRSARRRRSASDSTVTGVAGEDPSAGQSWLVSKFHRRVQEPPPGDVPGWLRQSYCAACRPLRGALAVDGGSAGRARGSGRAVVGGPRPPVRSRSSRRSG